MDTGHISHFQEDNPVAWWPSGQKKENSMTKDKNGLALRQHDVVRFVEDHNTGAPQEGARAYKGNLGVVHYVSEWSGALGVTLARSGVAIAVNASRLEKVPGQWLPANGKPVTAGETLIRPKHDLSMGVGSTAETFLKNGVHLLKRVEGGASSRYRDFYIKDGDKYAWADVNFEVFVPEAGTVAPNPRAQAMTFATAQTYVSQFKALGVKTRIRQRSWDEEGLYAALEELTNLGSVTKKLYTAAACTARIEELRAAQVPIDVVGEAKNAYLKFPLQGGGHIPAPDKSSAWSLAEIRAARGLAWHEGKKYRLCVTRVVPIYNEATGEATGPLS